MAGMSVGELFVKLGVQAETAKLKDFAAGIANTAMSTVALVAGLAGLSYGLKEMLSNAMDASTELKTFNSTTGMSMQMLQKWQLVAERVFVAPEVMTQSLTRLQDIYTKITKFGEGNMRPFNLIGVDIRGKTPEQLLLSIREGLKRYTGDKSMQRNIIEEMGLSPELMKVFELSNSQMKAMGVERLLMTDKETNNLNKLKVSLIELRQEFEKNAFRALGESAPQIEMATKALLGMVTALVALSKELKLLQGMTRVLDNLGNLFEILRPKNMVALMNTWGEEISADSLAMQLAHKANKERPLLEQFSSVAGSQALALSGFSSIMNLTQNITTSASARETAEESSRANKEVQEKEHQRVAAQLRKGR